MASNILLIVFLNLGRFIGYMVKPKYVLDKNWVSLLPFDYSIYKSRKEKSNFNFELIIAVSENLKIYRDSISTSRAVNLILMFHTCSALDRSILKTNFKVIMEKYFLIPVQNLFIATQHQVNKFFHGIFIAVSN